MKPLALDTPLHVEQRWIAGLRAKGALWRLQRLVSMTHFCWHAAYSAFQRARPEATPMEREAWLLQEALRTCHGTAHHGAGLHPRTRQKGTDGHPE
jgi:hypothetical protein